MCEAVRCRRQILLSYFGEQSDVCGNCDICKNGIKLVEGTEDAQKVLSAIKRTGERFGVTHIVNVLIGSESENIKKFSPNQQVDLIEYLIKVIEIKLKKELL